jgi:hypothetical protein
VKALGKFGLFCVALILALSLAELSLRLAGFEPWRLKSNQARLYGEGPRTHEPDPVLGWRNKPGTYVRPGYVPGSRNIKTTLLNGGRRATGPQVSAGSTRLVCIGGSFTQGSAVSDEDTFAWKLQKMWPHVQIENYGTAGYGTYQSLLLLERILAGPAPPETVLYGFIELHEGRNVAEFEYLRMLSEYASSADVAISLPYCLLDKEGNLLAHAPRPYPVCPLRERLAIVNAVQERLLKLLWQDRGAQRRRVTERLLLEMNDRCRAAGAELIVVLLRLTAEAKDRYVDFLGRSGIHVIDGSLKWSPRLRVQGEGHPSAEAHTQWARIIGNALRARIPAEGGAFPL